MLCVGQLKVFWGKKMETTQLGGKWDRKSAKIERELFPKSSKPKNEHMHIENKVAFACP